MNRLSHCLSALLPFGNNHCPSSLQPSIIMTSFISRQGLKDYFRTTSSLIVSVRTKVHAEVLTDCTSTPYSLNKYEKASDEQPTNEQQTATGNGDS
jgi:hypothetical protein